MISGNLYISGCNSTIQMAPGRYAIPGAPGGIGVGGGGGGGRRPRRPMPVAVAHIPAAAAHAVFMPPPEALVDQAAAQAWLRAQAAAMAVQQGIRVRPDL